MKLIVAENYKELSEKACNIVIREIKKKKKFVLGLAAGKTPLGLYKCLTKNLNSKKIKSELIIFNLDEFWPIKKTDKRSFYYQLNKNFLSKIKIKKENIHLFNGETENPLEECKNFEKAIKRNPIDLQILGVGKNGHIAFNEPLSSQESKTRVVKLSKETLADLRKKYKKNFPEKALTLGIKTILKAKKLLLLASGEEKADAIKNLLMRKINKSYPVTFLNKHKNLIVIIDKKLKEEIR